MTLIAGGVEQRPLLPAVSRAVGIERVLRQSGRPNGHGHLSSAAAPAAGWRRASGGQGLSGRNENFPCRRSIVTLKMQRKLSDQLFATNYKESLFATHEL